MTTNRLALVTGGARGIGSAIARQLASQGLRVAICGLDEEASREAAAALPGEGHSGWRMDVSDESEVEKTFEAVEAQHGPVAVLVCNAGISLKDSHGAEPLVINTSLSAWEQSFAVNARGTFLSSRAYMRRRVKTPVSHGRVVTLSSAAAQLGGYQAGAAYVASKSAILGFTKALAREAAPYGITVNSIAPGPAADPSAKAPAKAEHSALIGNIPMQRLGVPQDVAAVVGFLVSEAAGYLTGTTNDVNGGYRMQ